MSTNELGIVYERPWGTYETLKYAECTQVKIITVNPGGILSLQKHFKRSEHWVVIKGKPSITLGTETKEYKVGDHVFIPIEEIHRIANYTDKPTQIIEVQLGEYLGEDDIVRLEDAYKRY